MFNQQVQGQDGGSIGFKAFLREHDLPMGTFVRYVGNRRHVLFHIAGLIIHHHEKLVSCVDKKGRNVLQV